MHVENETDGVLDDMEDEGAVQALGRRLDLRELYLRL